MFFCFERQCFFFHKINSRYKALFITCEQYQENATLPYSSVSFPSNNFKELEIVKNFPSNLGSVVVSLSRQPLLPIG